MTKEVVKEKTYEELATENMQMRVIIGKQNGMAEAMATTFMDLQKTDLSDVQQIIFDNYAKAYAELVATGEMEVTQ